MQTYERVASFRQLVAYQTPISDHYDAITQISRQHNPQNSTQFMLEGEETAVLAGAKASANRVFLHVITYKEGGKVGVIPNPASNQSEIKVSDYKAPANMEFVKSQYLIIATKNGDVIWTYYNQKPSDSECYTMLKSLLEHFHHYTLSKDFELQQVIDFDKLKTIRDEGVKEIQFGMGAVADKLDFFLNGLSDTKTDLWSRIQNILKENNKKDLGLEGLNAAITIDAGGKWSTPRLKSVLESTADTMVRSPENEFVIVTGKGNKIRRDRLTLSPKIRLKGTDAAVNIPDALNQLNNIMDDLEERQIAGPRDS